MSGGHLSLSSLERNGSSTLAVCLKGWESAEKSAGTSCRTDWHLKPGSALSRWGRLSHSEPQFPHLSKVANSRCLSGRSTGKVASPRYCRQCGVALKGPRSADLDFCSVLTELSGLSAGLGMLDASLSLVVLSR